MTQIALITGASSGIGVGIAKVLAAKVLTRHDYSHNQKHIYNLLLLLNYRHHYDQHEGSNSGSFGSKGTQIQRQKQWQRQRQRHRKSAWNTQLMLYFWNPDDSLIPNMMIDTSPWSSCSCRSPWSPWLPCSSHTFSSTGPSVSPFRDFFTTLQFNAYFSTS